MEEPKLTHRIGWIGGFLVISIAIIADLLQVVLSLTVVLAPGDDIVTVVAEGFIGFFFFIKGVKFFSGKKSLSRGVTFFAETIIELVPILDALPTLTLGTLYQIHTTRVEDKLNFAEKHAQWEADVQKQEQQEMANAVAAYQARLRRAQALAANDNEEAEEYQEAA